MGFPFEIHCADSKQRSYVLDAESAEERAAWIADIKKAIDGHQETAISGLGKPV